MICKANPYSVAKIAHHPEALERFRTGEPQAPIFVQIFPTNTCNSSCRYCAYGHWRGDTQNSPPEAWINHVLFSDHHSIPWEKMLETLRCLGSLGTKAVEITGGGEPLTYRYFGIMIEEIVRQGMEVALVSNGTLLDEFKAGILGDANFTWARISIDAGTSEQYSDIHQVSAAHFTRAWKAVEYLACRKRREEAVVGVGYVVDRQNWMGIYQGCLLAKEHGADNIRVSLAFTPERRERLSMDIVKAVCDSVSLAKAQLEDSSFRISDLSAERWDNLAKDHQGYPFCYWKEIGCIIGADSQIYSCCSLAYNPRGLVESIVDRDFREVWFDKEVVYRRQRHQPRLDCPVWCLYEQRNLQAIRFIIDPELEEVERTKATPPHINFV